MKGYKRIPVGKLNQETNKVLAQVDKEGAAIITKHENDTYIIFTIKEYLDNGKGEKENMDILQAPLWIKDQSGNICKVEKEKGIVKIIKLQLIEHEEKTIPGWCKIITIPESSVLIIDETPIRITVVEKGTIQQMGVDMTMYIKKYETEEEKEIMTVFREFEKLKEPIPDAIIKGTEMVSI